MVAGIGNFVQVEVQVQVEVGEGRRRKGTVHGIEVVARSLEYANMHHGRGRVGPACEEDDGLIVLGDRGKVSKSRGVEGCVDLCLECARLRGTCRVECACAPASLSLSDLHLLSFSSCA